MSERLYYYDSYLSQFSGRVIWRSEDGPEVALDRSVFYPTSGGQPHDLGQLNGIAVLEVKEVGDRVVHRLEAPLRDDQVHGEIDWGRRLDHMRQHTGQHLLSAVMEEQFGLRTVSFHMGAGYATVDVEPNRAADWGAVERAVNERLMEDQAVRVSFEDAAMAKGLRKAPDREGLLRIVTIEGTDRSACGGTHVRRTGEVGCIVLGGTEKVRQSTRVGFYCGARARVYLRGKLEEARGWRERFAEVDKQRRKLALELAGVAGERKYSELNTGQGRVLWREEVKEVGEELRASVQAYLEKPGAMVLLSSEGTVLLGAHPDVGVDCGARLMAAIALCGGKGGGSAKLAQGTIANRSRWGEAEAALLA
ncbi:MAG: alanyl-tRNA editing protein [Acidobacteriota bacterium]